MPYRIFLVSGRDSGAIDFIEQVLFQYGVEVVKWNMALGETKRRNSLLMTLDIVWGGLNEADEVFVLSTPDEYSSTKREFRQNEGAIELQPRPNVTLELGMAYALSEIKKTPLTLIHAKTRIPSDARGIYHLEFDGDIIDRIYDHLSPRMPDIRRLDEETAAGLKKRMPDFSRDSVMFDRIHDTEAGIVALKTRGVFDAYEKRFDAAKSIKIIGAVSRRILGHITKTPGICAGKKIQILLPSSCFISNNFDNLENQYGRHLIDEIRALVRNLDLVKSENARAMKGVETRFYTCYMPSSLYIFDDALWITPYTHVQASDSPTFLMTKAESLVVFKHYLQMFDHIWKNKSRSSILCDRDYFTCDFAMKHTHLGCPNDVQQDAVNP
jgi:hypothetical protein